MTQEFIGSGKPISADGRAVGNHCVRVGLPEIWAVLRVETRGCGFLPDRRPQILFERHIFHRETRGAWTPWPRVSVIPSRVAMGRVVRISMSAWPKPCPSIAVRHCAVRRGVLGRSWASTPKISGLQTSR